MRILAVNWLDRTNPQAGGAEVHLHEILGRLTARHEVHLLCSGYAGGADTEQVDGIRVHRVSTRYGFALTGGGAFMRLARQLRPDVVIEDVNKVPLNLPRRWPGPFVLIVPHLFGTTVFQEAPLPVAALVWASELSMPRVYDRAGIHVISRSTGNDLVARGFRAEAIRVILPGVDADKYAPDPRVERASDPSFLYVGRLKRYKQVDVAIRALAHVRDVYPRARLLVAGSGDDRPRLVRVAAEAGLADAVEFLGYVAEEQKLALYRRAWAVVFPSLKEGWGITNVEAAACGTPAIAADNSALRESVRDGETGFLVPTGEVAAWSAAMNRLANDAALRERLGRGARAFGQTFSWTRTAQETESHLEAVMAAWPPGREP